MINDAYIQIKGHLGTSGYFNEVFLGEPVSIGHETGLTAAIWTTGMRIPFIMMSSAVRVYDTRLRIYARAFQRDTKQMELGLSDAVFQVTSDLLGEYNLGGYAREIDAGGMYGSPMQTTWGNVAVDDTIYRIADIDMGIVMKSSNETSLAR